MLVIDDYNLKCVVWLLDPFQFFDMSRILKNSRLSMLPNYLSNSLVHDSFPFHSTTVRESRRMTGCWELVYKQNQPIK